MHTSTTCNRAPAYGPQQHMLYTTPEDQDTFLMIRYCCGIFGIARLLQVKQSETLIGQYGISYASQNHENKPKMNFELRETLLHKYSTWVWSVVELRLANQVTCVIKQWDTKQWYHHTLNEQIWSTAIVTGRSVHLNVFTAQRNTWSLPWDVVSHTLYPITHPLGVKYLSLVEGHLRWSISFCSKKISA